ncbi:hypothetical protein [Corynebacterium aquilae]|uniref:Uncharacterized protein n=1 Tax=Corynebacterium aquilae DSM 44791 TaxID=1431546 RepID=A0A1L7CF78_9CORY|nr:hypothetical protein [Corynebacterium aquilae]APT84478.1 hypothetical protein CAQU_04725 [Corynebacterium aquilae DSM 44791]
MKYPFVATMRTMEDLYSDEFERQVFHESNSYAWVLGQIFVTGSCAAVSWLAPAGYWWLGLFPFIALMLVGTISGDWMRQRIPSPEMSSSYYKSIRGYLTVFVALAVLMVAPIAVKGLSPQLITDPEDTMSVMTGVVVGGLVGGIIAYFFTRWLSSFLRRKDQQRLEENTED